MQTTETNTPLPEATSAVAALASADKAKPAKAKRQRKPRAAKPAKPQSATDKRTADRERAAANVAITKPHYSGPSQASHRSGPPKLAEALRRIAHPIQHAKSATERDESALVLCLKHADGNGAFDPVQATSDLGTLSRLASLGFLTVAGNKAKLTKTGLDTARNVSKRKAA